MFCTFSKPLRILILHAQRVLDSQLLWKTIRCRHCGVGGRRFSAKQSDAYDVYQDQIQYLQSIASEHGIKSIDKCVRIILDLAIMRGDAAEMEVFGNSFPVQRPDATYSPVVVIQEVEPTSQSAPPRERTFFGLDRFRSAADASSNA
jgi:hypothetical protein